MILMHFLHKQGGFDKNSISYLRKIQRSLGEKDAKSNELVIFKRSLNIIQLAKFVFQPLANESKHRLL